MVDNSIDFFVAFFKTQFSSLKVGLLQFLQSEFYVSNNSLIRFFVG